MTDPARLTTVVVLCEAHTPSATPFAVRVRGVNTDDGVSSPQVTIDLRGHTLRGPGSGVAIDAYDYPNSSRVTVSDGRLERWDVGVTGLSTVRSVALVGNRVGIQCWDDCVSARNVFARNGVGLANFGESRAVITHSLLKRNRIGVEARNLGSTHVRGAEPEPVRAQRPYPRRPGLLTPPTG